MILSYSLKKANNWKHLPKRFRVIVFHLSFFNRNPFSEDREQFQRSSFFPLESVLFKRKWEGWRREEGNSGGWYFPLVCVDKMGGKEKGRWDLHLGPHFWILPIMGSGSGWCLLRVYASSFSPYQTRKDKSHFSPFHFFIPLIKHSWWKISISSFLPFYFFYFFSSYIIFPSSDFLVSSGCLVVEEEMKETT